MSKSMKWKKNETKQQTNILSIYILVEPVQNVSLSSFFSFNKSACVDFFLFQKILFGDDASFSHSEKHECSSPQTQRHRSFENQWPQRECDCARGWYMPKHTLIHCTHYIQTERAERIVFCTICNLCTYLHKAGHHRNKIKSIWASKVEEEEEEVAEAATREERHIIIY